MAQWQRHLLMKDVWDSGDVNLIARTLSKRLAALEPLDDDLLEMDREEFVERFADLSDDATATTSEFDEILEELYNWADTKLDDRWNGKRVCWIAT